MKQIDKISQHVEILNRELGIVANDVRWIKKLLWGILGAIVTIAISLLSSFIVK